MFFDETFCRAQSSFKDLHRCLVLQSQTDEAVISVCNVHFSFYFLSDDEADSQTEGEELARAREIRMQEVKLMPLPTLPTDTETDVSIFRTSKCLPFFKSPLVMVVL